MIRSRSGGTALATLALAMFPLLAACTGDSPDFGSVGPNHPHAEAGPIDVRSAVLVTSPDGQDASLVVTLVNNGVGPDVLESVRVGRLALAASPASTASPQEPIDEPADVSVPAGVAVHIGEPGQASVIIRDIGELAAPGQYVILSLLFERAGLAEVETMLQAPTGYYAAYAPSPRPTPTPSPTLSGTPSSGTPSPTGSPSPTASPS